MITENEPNGTPSNIFRDAEIEARTWSTDELLANIEVCAIDIEDPDPDWPGETGRWRAAEQLRAYQAELDRRTRIFSLPESKASKYAKDRESWAQLARTVRETVSITEALLLVGCPPIKTGTRRNGETEYHGPCPACGGTDRLVSWDGPRSRCWCRKCGMRADAIAIMQEFFPGCSHFRDAVRMLANLASVAGGQQ